MAVVQVRTTPPRSTEGSLMRVTGGTFRSRALSAPKGRTTRPTTDRVREALFSALASRGALPAGARILDLYAGSGALSFEALSRGAGAAVLVESDRTAATCIRENTAALGVESRVRVIPTSVEKALEKLSAERFDLVLVDPPYERVSSAPFAAELSRAAALVSPHGWLVLEHGKRDTPPMLVEIAWEDAREYGDTHVSLGSRVD
jgi:16S rRNA (guanine966-N2)-methyltransferase